MRTILDACCGSRMFHFNKENPNVLFGDIRSENHILCDGRTLEIKPDLQIDFKNLPFPDRYFKMVIFDPPHLKHLGANSWMAKKYGVLNKTWKDDIKTGFNECFRVLDNFGTLIFKWNEEQIKVKEILELTDYKPVVGHTSGRSGKTHFIVFLKEEIK